MIYYENNNIDSLLESAIDCINIRSNPIIKAKADPTNILLVNYENKYYVDYDDISVYIETAGIGSMAEALNNIIESHANINIDADNICIMLNEYNSFAKNELDEIGCLYEINTKITDIPGLNFDRVFTFVKSKIAGKKYGKQASIEVYDKEINKLKDKLSRIEADIEQSKKNNSKMEIKDSLIFAGKAIIATLPSIALAATGVYFGASRIDKILDLMSKTKSISGESAPVLIAKMVGGLSGAVGAQGVIDRKYYLNEIKKYYIKTIDKLEKAKSKIKD